MKSGEPFFLLADDANAILVECGRTQRVYFN
jgi:hypothetical protein